MIGWGRKDLSRSGSEKNEATRLPQKIQPEERKQPRLMNNIKRGEKGGKKKGVGGNRKGKGCSCLSEMEKGRVSYRSVKVRGYL